MAAKKRGEDKSEPGVQVVSIAKAKKQAHPEDEMRLWKFINGVFSQLKQDCPIFGILVIGETGTGKSTLINNLLGKEVAKVGHTMYSQTLFVTPHELSVEGVPVVVYDTPGLEETGADKDEKKHLEIMESLLARGKIHLVIYCLKMTETRMRKGLIRTFEEYHKIGVPWERTVITLTFADKVEDTTSGKLFEMRQQVKATLTERVGVRSSTSERVKICPTAKDPNIALPTGRPWYVPFWLDVVEVLVPAALVQFLRIHNDSIHMKSMPASSHPELVRVTLVGEDKERFQREVIRLSGSSQSRTVTDNDGNDAILSQKVYDRRDHYRLFRKHVSRTTAGKGSAVLEGVGLDTASITACFEANPNNEEEAVQVGLSEWIYGQGLQPPTWKVLLEAMSYANVEKQHIQALKADLRLH